VSGLADFDPDRFLSPVAEPPAPIVTAELPRDWSIGLARLADANPPRGADPARWQQIIDDAEAFAQAWHDEALRLGWTLADVFGFGEFAFGVAVAIRGGRVVSMTEAYAIIADGDRRRAHYRRPAESVEPLWQIRAVR
jgi:hypothetical protein